MAKTIEIKLPSPPKGWHELTYKQWRLLHSIHGKYASEEAYLSKAFLLLLGLTPLLYAEWWKRLLSCIPLFRKRLRQTGRQVVSVEPDYIRWKQLYRMKDGTHFWMEDEEVMAFKESIRFVMKDPFTLKNPVQNIRIGRKMYQSMNTKLSDMEWIEYNICTARLTSYRESNNSQYIYLFICKLYRISDSKINKLKSSIDEIDIFLILLFWESCQKYFAKNYKHMFKKESPEKKKEKQEDPFIHEAEVTVFLAKEAFISTDKVRKMLTIDALTYLEQNAQEIEIKKKSIQSMK